MSEKKDDLLTNGLKLAGEVFLLPGASLLADGKVKSGLLHAGAGIAARAVLGGPFFLVAAANSFSMSLTGENLISHLRGTKDPRNTKLEDRVKQDAAEGMELHEIQESVSEDVEDLYLEAQSVSNDDSPPSPKPAT